MAGISSEAAKGIAYSTNKKKYNGIEETRELGLNQYDAELRILDPQIGIWWQVDPETEKMEMWSPYTSNYDNPILYQDPLGNEPECCGGLLGALADIGNKISIAVIGVAVGSLNVISGGAVSINPFGFRDKLRGTDLEGYDMAIFTAQVASMMPVPAGGGRKVPGTNAEFITPGGTSVKVGPTAPEITTINTNQSSSNATGGKYSHLKEPKKVEPGGATTPAQRKRILEENKMQNGGQLKSDGDGRNLNPPKQNKKGQKADMNQGEVDHIDPKSRGGSNSNSNLRVVSKEENLKKGNKPN